MPQRPTPTPDEVGLREKEVGTPHTSPAEKLLREQEDAVSPTNHSAASGSPSACASMFPPGPVGIRLLSSSTHNSALHQGGSAASRGSLRCPLLHGSDCCFCCSPATTGSGSLAWLPLPSSSSTHPPALGGSRFETATPAGPFPAWHSVFSWKRAVFSFPRLSCGRALFLFLFLPCPYRGLEL